MITTKSIDYWHHNDYELLEFGNDIYLPELRELFFERHVARPRSILNVWRKVRWTVTLTQITGEDQLGLV